MIKKLKNTEEDIKEKYYNIKEIDDNILKVREKYIYLLYYHNSFLRGVFEKEKTIVENDYNKCFINIEKEIL